MRNRLRGASRADLQLTDLPDGLAGKSAVQPHLQKYFRSRLTQISPRTPAVSPHRGAYRDRHGRGAGCGGRGSARAHDLIAGRVFP
jgi:hypothetical protein